MYTTELIRKFPKVPNRKILFVIYDKEFQEDAETFIRTIHGDEYMNDFVEIVTIKDNVDKNHYSPAFYEIWIDPTVFKYMGSWN